MKKVDALTFRGLPPHAKLAQIRGMHELRAFTIERSGIDEKARTVWLSIASEAPYERWWGIEILDMKKSSIRDERLRSGAALLINHDSGAQVGVVEAHELTSDKKLRILARFGRSDRAEEMFRDVLDGIRRNASVGYVIHDAIIEKQEGDLSFYRITDWEPLEGSLVAIPADASVGVGRSTTQSIEGRNMPERTEQVIPAGVQSSPDAERQRIADLLAAGDEYRDMGGPELARRLVLEPAASVDTFKARMLESMRGRQRPSHTAQPGGDRPAFGEGAREVLPTPQYFTGEGAQERAYRSGMWFRAYLGQCIPRYRSEAAERFVRDNGLNRSMGEGVLTGGGALVPDELSPAIIDLSNVYGVFRREADTYPMNGDTLSVPKSTGDPTASFVAENGSLSESDGSWGSVNLVTKKIGTIVRISTELVEDSVIAIADRLAFQLSRAFANKEDACGFNGDGGGSTYGGMRGIFTLLAGSLAGKVTAASNHDTFAEIDATDLSDLMAALPEYAHSGAKFYCSQVAWSKVFWRLMAAAGGNRASDVAGAVPKSYAGYPVVTSSVLPAGVTTDYSALTMLAFGNLRLASVFGARRDIRIQILNETYAASDQIGVMGTERFHIVNHGVGDASVAGPIVGLIGD